MNITMTTDEFRRREMNGGDAKKRPANRKVTKADRTKLEDAFLAAWRCVAKDLPEPIRQYKFHSARKWRFDFAWVCSRLFEDRDYRVVCKLAVEIQGGQWSNGAHNRGSGQAKDHEKLNAAAADGWHVFQFATGRMKDPYKVAAEVAEILRARIGAKQ